MTWALSSTLGTFLPAVDSAFDVAPDVSGNHLPDPEASPNFHWLGVSGDGSVLLGARTLVERSATTPARGILIGLE
jgi:hypothetical protein